MNFICEDQNCKGEGLLDIEKNNFIIIHSHEIKHKDYHINEDSHFTVNFFGIFYLSIEKLKPCKLSFYQMNMINDL